VRRTLALTLIALFFFPVTPALARAGWKRRIDRLTQGRSIGIAVHERGRFVYRRGADVRRAPASNEKLILAMALLDRLGPRFRLPTVAAVRRLRQGVVRGPLWVLGRGDPAVASGGRFARSLPFRPTRVGQLARRIAGAGVKAIRGGIAGSRGYFRRDWDAPGWRSYYQRLYIALPTALTLNGNVRRGRHITNPELLFAEALTRRLRSLGVRVRGPAISGHPPGGLRAIARVRSRPLRTLLRYTNRTSSNFFAEVLGKRLAVERRGPPGTIRGAGRALTAWARRHGVRSEAHDASGLSHANRISARGVVRLLVSSLREPWGRVLRRTLPRSGQGTLRDRLAGVRLRGKTGTLVDVSALSGWVWRRGGRRWAAFSILSRGMPKHRAVEIEDRVVRILARSGGPSSLQVAEERGRPPA
jgi:D-alanyl-D-alanine carboxypeptidase